MAVVVADTPEQAVAAARLVAIDYQRAEPVLGIGNPGAPVVRNPRLETKRGDATAALASAAVTYDETFTTPAEMNNPIGLFATVARWDGGRLVVHDCTQWPMMTWHVLAPCSASRKTTFRVLVPYLGGGFGAGLITWPHVILAALAARVTGRPVKLVLTRPQMFTSVGHRAQTVQRLRLGATRDFTLTAIDHDATSTVGAQDATMEPVTAVTPLSYACANVATHGRQVRLNVPNPGWLRAPGKAVGNFPLESALDELSYALGIDPVDLRLRNHADVNPQSGRPWSSNALRECYLAGAEHFGWPAAIPRSGRCATASGWSATGWPGSPSAPSTDPAGPASRSAGTAPPACAAPPPTSEPAPTPSRRSSPPNCSACAPARSSPRSGTATCRRPPVRRVGSGDGAERSDPRRRRKLLRTFLDLAPGGSPLHGRSPDEVTVADGCIHLIADPSAKLAYTDLLAGGDLDEVTADGQVTPQAIAAGMPPAGAFAAHFAEVRVDEDLGLVRVTRMTSAVDAGRILNQKLARSQILGAVVMGIGMTLFEETVFDPATGRIANPTFADYLIPVSADIPDLDVIFVGSQTGSNPVGVKGLGEIGIVGVPAAIANAVYHATACAYARCRSPSTSCCNAAGARSVPACGPGPRDAQTWDPADESYCVGWGRAGAPIAPVLDARLAASQPSSAGSRRLVALVNWCRQTRSRCVCAGT